MIGGSRSGSTRMIPLVCEPGGQTLGREARLEPLCSSTLQVRDCVDDLLPIIREIVRTGNELESETQQPGTKFLGIGPIKCVRFANFGFGQSQPSREQLGHKSLVGVNQGMNVTENSKDLFVWLL